MGSLQKGAGVELGAASRSLLLLEQKSKSRQKAGAWLLPDSWLGLAARNGCRFGGAACWSQPAASLARAAGTPKWQERSSRWHAASTGLGVPFLRRDSPE